MDQTSLDRRTLLASLAAAAGLSGYRAQVPEPSLFRRIEKETGGKLGFYAKDFATGEELAHRAGEAFAMCSTFKSLLAGFAFEAMEQGALAPDRVFAYREEDLISYSPVLKPRLEAGAAYMTAASLANVIVTISDNTAANLLLEWIGGPAALTERVRAMPGGRGFRLDRNEPGLNSNRPGDPRDKATPKAMVTLLNHMLFAGGIGEGAAAQLRASMIDCRTGLARLRSGFAEGVVAGDKTGTSGNGLFGDTAFILREGGRPIVMAAYLDAPGISGEAGNDVMRRLGAATAAAFPG